jgi:HSP20 family protein
LSLRITRTQSQREPYIIVLQQIINTTKFNYQSFQRVFNVSEDDVKVDDISAKYMDGILKVNLPKKEEGKSKKSKTIKVS